MDAASADPDRGLISVRLYRFDPASDAEPRYETHELVLEEPVSVMVLMRRLHGLCPACACRTSMCFKGACGACLVRVNGADVLGCSAIVWPGEAITLEPHSGYELIRDLVVDFSCPRAREESTS